MLLSEPDQKMFAKYYGQRELIHNDAFWEDVLKVYMDRNVPLPYALTEKTIALFMSYFRCTPGECAECCNKPWLTPVTKDDLCRLGASDPYALKLAIKHLSVANNGQMNIQGPCPFLEEGTCVIYGSRPDCCASFPVQKQMHVKVNLGEGKDVEQLWVRVKCQPGVFAIRGMIRQVLEEEPRLVLLPNLNLVMEA